MSDATQQEKYAAMYCDPRFVSLVQSTTWGLAGAPRPVPYPGDFLSVRGGDQDLPGTSFADVSFVLPGAQSKVGSEQCRHRPLLLRESDRWLSATRRVISETERSCVDAEGDLAYTIINAAQHYARGDALTAIDYLLDAFSAGHYVGVLVERGDRANALSAAAIKLLARSLHCRLMLNTLDGMGASYWLHSALRSVFELSRRPGESALASAESERDLRMYGLDESSSSTAAGRVRDSS